MYTVKTLTLLPNSSAGRDSNAAVEDNSAAFYIEKTYEILLYSQKMTAWALHSKQMQFLPIVLIYKGQMYHR